MSANGQCPACGEYHHKNETRCQLPVIQPSVAEEAGGIVVLWIFGLSAVATIIALIVGACGY